MQTVLTFFRNRLASTALFVLIPAATSNLWIQYCERRFAAADQKYREEVIALAAAGALQRAEVTISGRFYGTLEDQSRLSSLPTRANYGFLDVVHEIEGRQYQLQIHECPVGARYAGDTVYSGSLVVWDDKRLRAERVAEIHSLGAWDAASYTFYRSQTKTLVDALTAITAEAQGQPFAINARSYRALLEACQTKKSEASSAALVRAVLAGINPETNDR